MAKKELSEKQKEVLEKNNFKNKTPAERRELGARGAAKTNQIREEKRTFAQICEIIAKLPDEETGELNEIAVINAIFKKAKNGDVSAFAAIRDTMGQKPTDKQEITNTTPQIIVQNEETYNALKRLDNALSD